MLLVMLLLDSKVVVDYNFTCRDPIINPKIETDSPWLVDGERDLQRFNTPSRRGDIAPSSPKRPVVVDDVVVAPRPVKQSKWDFSVNSLANSKPRVAIESADDVDAAAVAPV